MTKPEKNFNIKNRDIIIFGLQSWDDESLGSNCKDLAKEFSKYNRVLYINTCITRLDWFKFNPDPILIRRKRIIKGELPSLNKIAENFWTLNPKIILEPLNKLRPNFLFDRVNRINNKRLAKQILSTLQTLNFTNYILFNDQEMFRGYYMKELLKPSCYIYYIRDNLIHTSYFQKNGGRLEPKLINNSDLIATNSVYLQKYARKYNPKSFYIGQGCNLNLFDPNKNYPIPKDLEVIPHPRIGYIGALTTSRLDLDMISYLAKTKPKWNLVFIGTEDKRFMKSELHRLGNIFFLGSKPLEILPSYLQKFDVCINPQLINEMTRGNYPRKADEYLAMGKSLVATLTEEMVLFDKYCYLCRSKEEFGEKIALALERGDPPKAIEERRKFALEHTWEHSFRDLSKAFQDVMFV